MFDIISHYKTSDFNDVWGKKSAYHSNGKIIHHKMLDVLNEINFCNFTSFSTIEEFVNYINNILVKNNIETAEFKDINSQIKGYIFELFVCEMLNYFCTFDVIERNNNIAPRYTFKYVSCTPEKYNDYGIDLLCRLTDNTGISKNAVIQVKYRKNEDDILKADIQDKLLAQGVYFKFIDPVTIDSTQKTLVLVTDVKFDKYRPAFEKNPIYKKLLVIDGNTINNIINNYDFWQYFKEVLKKLY